MITIYSQKFFYPDYYYGVAGSTSFLYGCIGDRVRVETIFDIQWSTEAVNMTFDAALKTVTRNDGLSFISDEFKVGDTIKITGTASNNISTSIVSISDFGDYMTLAAVSSNETVVATIRGTTPITSLDYYPNICENSSDSLFNLTDRNTVPRYFSTNITNPMSTRNMTIGSNSHGWVAGEDGITERCTIDGIQVTTDNRQRFTIKHTFLITPIYLAGQLKNLQKRLPPAAGNYRDRQALKYICKIDAKYSNYDPNIPHSLLLSDNKGNTAWFNEFVNGNPSDYWFESISIKDDATGLQLDRMDYCKKMNFVIKIASHGRFITGIEATEFTALTIMYLPTKESDYIDTLTDYKKNFILERAVHLIATAAVDGENTGDYHFITNYLSTRIDDNHMTLTFSVLYSAALKEIFEKKGVGDRNYLIYATFEQGFLSSPLDGERSAIICDVNYMDCNKDNALAFQIIDAVNFYEYGSCTGNGYTEVVGMERDTWKGVAQFYLQEGIKLNDLSVKIIATNGVDSFNLETFSIDTSSMVMECLGNSKIQQLKFWQLNQFKLPVVSCFNEVTLFRAPTLDYFNTYNYYGYQFEYPFKLRWEDWLTVFPANDCFLNPSHKWSMYQKEGWELKYVIEANALEIANKHITNFQHFSDITIKDKCEITTVAEIKTYDSLGSIDLHGLILKKENTFVKIIFKGDFAALSVPDIYAILYLDAQRIGGINFIYQISNLEDNSATDPLQGSLGMYKLYLHKQNSSEIVANAFIKSEFMPAGISHFVLSARLGYKQNNASASFVALAQTQTIEFTCAEITIINVIDSDTIVIQGFIKTAEDQYSILEITVARFSNTVWTISYGGTVDGRSVVSGTIQTDTNNYPIHPYTNSLIGQFINGNVTGSIVISI